jgi:molecular chaperone GrpE
MERTVESLEQELKTEHDLHLRALADFDNFRRRVTRERAHIGKEALRDFIRSLLDAVDDMERLLEFAGDDTSPIIDAVRAVYRKIMSLLAKNGVRPIESVGQPFDPALHEVVATVAAVDKALGVVVQEVRRGYVWDGDLLRSSQVVVTA